VSPEAIREQIKALNETKLRTDLTEGEWCELNGILMELTSAANRIEDINRRFAARDNK